MLVASRQCVVPDSFPNDASDSCALLLGWLCSRFIGLHGNLNSATLIYSRYLRKCRGRDYAKDCKWLESNRFIHRSRGYSTGERSKLFWVDCHVWRHGIRIHNLTRRRTFSYRMVPGCATIPTKKLELQLSRCLKNLSFEPDAATKRADAMLLSKLSHGCYHFHRDRFGRIHTTATQLSQMARRAMLINEEPTVEVDVSCCQPAILGALIRETNGANEVQRFCDLASRGELYQELFAFFDGREITRKQFWPKWVKEYRFDTSLISINDVKKQMVRYLFTSNEKMNSYAVSEAFRGLFPMMETEIRKIKDRDHRKMAHLLQRLESKAMIDYAARALLKRTQLVTIHDSIRLPYRFRDYAIEAILDGFERMGCKVKVGEK